MAASVFYIPSVNIIGSDSLNTAMDTMRDYGWRRALIVSDTMLSKLGMVTSIQQALKERDISSVVYDGTHPNPTTANVAAGLEILKANQCDCIISLGGGSPHDCAKGIAIAQQNHNCR